MKLLIFVSVTLAAFVIFFLLHRKYKISFSKNRKMIIYARGPFDRQRFNNRFVEANKVLARGDSESLKEGIVLFGEAMSFAGDVYADNLLMAISHLRCALTYHDRADRKGPWNRDLSGYGVLNWKNDLLQRDEAFFAAWPYINTINDSLKNHGLGLDG